jgi:hypothetical protein
MIILYLGRLSIHYSVCAFYKFSLCGSGVVEANAEAFFLKDFIGFAMLLIKFLIE